MLPEADWEYPDYSGQAHKFESARLPHSRQGIASAILALLVVIMVVGGFFWGAGMIDDGPGAIGFIVAPALCACFAIPFALAGLILGIIGLRQYRDKTFAVIGVSINSIFLALVLVVILCIIVH